MKKKNGWTFERTYKLFLKMKTFFKKNIFFYFFFGVDSALILCWFSVDFALTFGSGFCKSQCHYGVVGNEMELRVLDFALILRWFSIDFLKPYLFWDVASVFRNHVMCYIVCSYSYHKPHLFNNNVYFVKSNLPFEKEEWVDFWKDLQTFFENENFF